jgi:hypothetical protein
MYLQAEKNASGDGEKEQKKRGWTTLVKMFPKMTLKIGADGFFWPIYRAKKPFLCPLKNCREMLFMRCRLCPSPWNVIAHRLTFLFFAIPVVFLLNTPLFTRTPKIIARFENQWGAKKWN